MSARAEKRTLYALWYGSQCVGNILGATGLDAAHVRSLALAEHERVPLNNGLTTPYEHKQKLRNSWVKVYEDGRGRVIE